MFHKQYSSPGVTVVQDGGKNSPHIDMRACKYVLFCVGWWREGVERYFPTVRSLLSLIPFSIL
jgi:hypothetical protein